MNNVRSQAQEAILSELIYCYALPRMMRSQKIFLP